MSVKQAKLDISPMWRHMGLYMHLIVDVTEVLWHLRGSIAHLLQGAALHEPWVEGSQWENLTAPAALNRGDPN